MKKYQPYYNIVKTMEQVNNIIWRYNATATPYQRKKYPAHYTRWTSQDGTFDGFVVWTSW